MKRFVVLGITGILLVASLVVGMITLASRPFGAHASQRATSATPTAAPAQVVCAGAVVTFRNSHPDCLRSGKISYLPFKGATQVCNQGVVHVGLLLTRFPLFIGAPPPGGFHFTDSVDLARGQCHSVAGFANVAVNVTP